MMDLPQLFLSILLFSVVATAWMGYQLRDCSLETTSSSFVPSVIDVGPQRRILPQQQQQHLVPPPALAGNNNNNNKNNKNKPNITLVPLPRLLVFYVPQFRNVTDWKSLQQSPTHNRLGVRIPRPLNEDYYDAMDIRVRRKHASLAKSVGIDAFVYHHHWLYDDDNNDGGSTPQAPLSGPLLEAMLVDHQPDIPFCLQWGVLQEHHFPTNETAIAEHYTWLRRFFHHRNYVRIKNRPIFMIYQTNPSSFPILRRLKALALHDGLDLMLTLGLTKPHSDLQSHIITPTHHQPGMQSLDHVPWNLFDHVVNYPHPYNWTSSSSNTKHASDSSSNKLLRLPDWCLLHQHRERLKEIPGILVSFDNTPRMTFLHEDANVDWSDHPNRILERFRISLHAAVLYEACCFDKHETRNRLIVMNAWNEWDDGMVLEPSDVFGERLLDMISFVKIKVRTSNCQTPPDPVPPDPVPLPALSKPTTNEEKTIVNVE